MKKKLKPEELTQLVIQSQAGDLNAYSKIVRNFQDMAVGYSYSILGSFQLAEDAAQEAFIEAYLNLSKLRSPTVFPGWLKKIIFKHCDRFTRGKGFAIVALEDTDELASIHPEPTQIALENEVKDIVHCSIQTLPEGDRIVVTLFYISGYSQKEISNFLGLPISTIKNRLHSARNRLKTKMIDMVSDNLHSQRPSRNDDFAAKVLKILEASVSGDSILIKSLLQQEPSLVNIKSQEIKSTPLHFAAHRGHLEVVHSLITAGANVNAGEDNGSNSIPLHWAATGGHLEVSQVLVENGADMNAIDGWYNLTPLGWATVVKRYTNDHSVPGERYWEVCEYLLAKGAKLDIFSAMALGRFDDVSSLVANNPSVLQQRLGFALNAWQPLHYAVSQNLPEMVSLFLDRGADINTLTAWGMSSLCLAINQKNETMVQLLREQGANVDLSAAIAQQNWQLAETLLDAEPFKIQPGCEYQFLLHHTAKQGLTEATKMLLKYGADASIKTTYLFLGDYQTLFTPLHVAALYSQHQVAVILLDNSVKVNTLSSENIELAPLHLAAMKGDIEMIKLLLAQGADLTLKDSVHQGTPFDWAENFKQEAAMNMLK
ncbi:hypothetical protein CEN39_21405 [Fischerella thermalis CCMEE 5201]|jgi:RNA polymerase sigma factor (sigma-70 family)|nr:hypothetical protein CEN39_21405 [Fischerella thermalis CCMEE 5201]